MIVTLDHSFFLCKNSPLSVLYLVNIDFSSNRNPPLLYHWILSKGAQRLAVNLTSWPSDPTWSDILMFSTTTPSGVVWSLKAYHNNSVPARLFLQEKSLPNKKPNNISSCFLRGGNTQGNARNIAVEHRGSSPCSSHLCLTCWQPSRGLKYGQTPFVWGKVSLKKLNI